LFFGFFPSLCPPHNQKIYFTRLGIAIKIKI
jgi:hypothetical protein